MNMIGALDIHLCCTLNRSLTIYLTSVKWDWLGEHGHSTTRCFVGIPHSLQGWLSHFDKKMVVSFFWTL